jgi:hypothetical protein
MTRCPNCYGVINKNATVCKHCHSPLEKPGDENYIAKGFAIIDRECQAFMEKIELMSHSFFPHHVYSVDALMHSSHLEKIQATAGKMGDDMANWEERGVLSPECQAFYNEKMQELDTRMHRMIKRLKTRQYSTWEKIADFLMGTYQFIFHLALYHVKHVILPNVRSLDKMQRPAYIFGKTAENFGEFLTAMAKDFSEINGVKDKI